MEVATISKQFIALTINLNSGLRLVTGQRVVRNNFVYSIDQGLWLLVLLVCLEIVVTFLTADKPVVFSKYGLNYLGAIYLFDLVILMLIARLAQAETMETGKLLLAYLASMPIITVAFHLLTHTEQLYSTFQQGSGILLLLLLFWHLFIVIRLLRIILLLTFGKALLLAGLSLLLSISSIWFLPYTQLWYNNNLKKSDDSYSKLYDLSVEDLFYNQYLLVDQALNMLIPQRPGVPDLYLVAVGGYGLEKVFLNEVEYVRDLFDRRFDTSGRSIVLVNNIETLARYPLANRHNLADSLAVLGQIMDSNEDILFLFMTSHGSKEHKFSVSFGPVPLDDMTPMQVRNALDDAGIRWRVIVVSSCYSGGFIEPLRSPQSLIITAAADDRKSFGCGAQSEFTDFGTAYFKHALEKQPNFIEAFDIAAKWIEERESREKRTPSLPQRYIGSEIRSKLAQLGGVTYYETSVSQHDRRPDNCGSLPSLESCEGD
ncbi:MAG: C13 family peptidase [Candidatus Thiodiazotropha sp. (ex Cardiolucina cf. quadrata)]|nr:C13 family peptidase [Candidatus Thiodiazotropha sp. (ex Cardiolucina cf. quadrata)]